MVTRSASLILVAILGGTSWDADAQPQERRSYDELERVKPGAPAPARAAVETKSPRAPQDEAPKAGEPKPAVESFTWARISAAATPVRTLFDPKAATLRSLAAGTFIKVYRQRGDWLLAEVPGGLTGWTYSGYLTPTGTEGEFEVTAESVNFRPRPTKSDSYPLEPDRLERGNRVLVIDRKGDWAQVLAPPELRGWVAVDAVERSVPAGQAQPGFASQQREVVSALVDDMLARKEERSGRAALARAEKAFEKVDAEMESEFERGAEADLDRIAELYRGVGRENPDARVQAKIAQRLKMLGLQRSLLASIEAEKEMAAAEKAAREMAERRAAEATAQLREENNVQRVVNPRRTRYEYFGWLRQRGPGLFKEGMITYELERGGKVLFRVGCANGRYDITDFLGREIAIAGEVVPHTDNPPLIETHRIRILTNPRER